MTNNKLEPDYGRPNQRMAKAVRDAQKLFQAQAPDEAIALLKQNDIPLPVVERVILRRGPSRRRAPPSVCTQPISVNTTPPCSTCAQPTSFI